MEHGQVFDTVEEHQLPGREKLYVQVVKTPLYDAEGRIIGLQGVFWDITQKRRDEEELRQAHARLAESQEELRAKNLQMEDDLKMAREIQLTMLPQQYPAFAPDGGGASALQFTHRYLPTGSVGGDFFTISALSQTEAGVFICDVAGHGVRSALVTAMIRALVEELKPLATDPGQFLTKLNSDLCAILKHTGTPMLTTAFYLVADCRNGVVRYANAGHPKPLHARCGADQVLPMGGGGGKSQPVLGLFEDASYRSSETKLAPGDLVMMFTDGLVEVQNRAGELYSPALLLAGVQRRLGLPAAQLFDELLAEIRKFSAQEAFTDDVCLVGMEFAGRGAAALKRGA
jgi:sigma-B regulation protein RsbU (phosphoserine phosphatase)